MYMCVRQSNTYCYVSPVRLSAQKPRKASCESHRRKLHHKSGGFMASAACEPTVRVWGQSPQWGPEAEPWSEGQGAKPPEAESILFFITAN